MKEQIIIDLEKAIIDKNIELTTELLDCLNRETKNLYYYLINHGMKFEYVGLVLADYLGNECLNELKKQPNTDIQKRLENWGLELNIDFTLKPLEFLSTRALILLKNFELLGNDFENFLPIIEDYQEPFLPRLKSKIIHRFKHETKADFVAYLVMMATGLQKGTELNFCDLFIQWVWQQDKDYANEIIELLRKEDYVSDFFQEEITISDTFEKVSLDLIFACGGFEGYHYKFDELGEVLITREAFLLVGDIFLSPNNKTFNDLAEDF